MTIRRNYKRLSVPIIALYLFVTSIAFVFAITETEKLYQKYISEDKEEDKIVLLKEYGVNIISERLDTITSFSSQINPDYRILDIDKVVINTLLDEAKVDLQNYQSELSSADSLTEAQIIIDNVYNKTRIYQVVMPKAYGWRSVARSDFILRNNVLTYTEDLSFAIAYLKSQDVDTEDMEESLDHIIEVGEEVEYRVKIVKNSLDEMEPGRDLSEERSLLHGAREEMVKIQDLLVDVQFEMRQLIKMLEPHY